MSARELFTELPEWELDVLLAERAAEHERAKADE